MHAIGRIRQCADSGNRHTCIPSSSEQNYSKRTSIPSFLKTLLKTRRTRPYVAIIIPNSRIGSPKPFLSKRSTDTRRTAPIKVMALPTRKIMSYDFTKPPSCLFGFGFGNFVYDFRKLYWPIRGYDEKFPRFIRYFHSVTSLVARPIICSQPQSQTAIHR